MENETNIEAQKFEQGTNPPCANAMLGAVFLPTSNRVPQIEYKLIAIDVYGRYVMECSTNRNNIIYITKEQFERDFKNCT